MAAPPAILAISALLMGGPLVWRPRGSGKRGRTPEVGVAHQLGRDRPLKAHVGAPGRLLTSKSYTCEANSGVGFPCVQVDAWSLWFQDVGVACSAFGGHRMLGDVRFTLEQLLDRRWIVLLRQGEQKTDIGESRGARGKNSKIIAIGQSMYMRATSPPARSRHAVYFNCDPNHILATHCRPVIFACAFRQNGPCGHWKGDQEGWPTRAQHWACESWTPVNGSVLCVAP